MWGNDYTKSRFLQKLILSLRDYKRNNNVKVSLVSNIDRSFFVAHRNISIFKKVFKIIKKDLFVGGSNGDLDFDILRDIIQKFPNSYEMDKYVKARIDRILSEYIEYEDKSRYAYEVYLSKKKTKKKKNLEELIIQNNELEKFEFLLGKLKIMLNEEISYTEKGWQREILKVVLLL